MDAKPSTSAKALRDQMAADIGAAWPRIEGNISALDNWVLATLVALNGGASIALASVAKDLASNVLLPAALFVSGAVIAVISALVRRAAERRYMDQLLEARHAAIDPPDNGDTDSAVFNSWRQTNLMRLHRPTSSRALSPGFFVMLSLLAYVTGCGVLMGTWQPKAPASTAALGRG